MTTTSGSDNKLSVTGTFTADGDPNTDAVIFSKDDVTVNGLGTLTVESTDNGITSKDDLKVTGGTYVITAANKGLEATDNTINASDDGINAGQKSDSCAVQITINGGTIIVNGETVNTIMNQMIFTQISGLNRFSYTGIL